MSEKKNIDRLFQEKFKDFEITPPEDVWHNIEIELQEEKEERRIIPLWFKLSGVAAILLLALMLSMPLFKGVDTGNTPVVDDNNGTKQDPVKTISPVDKPIKPYQTVTDRNNEAVVLNPEDAVAAGNSGTAAKRTVTDGTNVTSSGTGAPAGSSSKVGSRASVNNNAVAFDKQSGTTSQKNSRNNRRSYNAAGIKENSSESAVAADRNHKRGHNRATGSNTNGIAIDNNIKYNDAKQAVAGNNRSSNNRQNQTNAMQNNGTTNAGNNVAQPLQNNNDIANTTTINDENTTPNANIIDKTSAEKAIAEAPLDTVKPQNELEKLLQEKLNGKKDEEEKAVAEADKTKWNIKPQLAPVFYNSLSNGSPIDSEFAGNSKDYNNDLSYGVGINYALNDRFSIRTGVNTVNLSYSTNDIQFYAALNEQTPNVTARGTIANIVVKSEGNEPTNSFDDQLPTQKFNGSLVQKMGYIEVPLEMSYKLVDKRFGIDVIGGVSTLFLNENNVSVRSSQGYTSEVGQAQNLNNIHFSTNIGVGFKYRFWKAFEANFEPMFKYQVNAFSNNSGNFKPYFIGLYSGISFSF